MCLRIWMTRVLAFSSIVVTAVASFGDEPKTPLSWKKTVIEGKFRSEGVAIADVNKDGKNDVLIGDSWYEAPLWTKHDIRKPADYGDGLHGYSECMTCWIDDVNGDGWPDEIVIGFPGKAPHWYENPKGSSGYWPQHEIWHTACNETPLLHRSLRRRPPRARDGLAAQRQGQRGPDGLVHARQRSHSELGNARCQRA